MKNNYSYKITTLFSILIIVFFLSSCNSKKSSNAERFKLGVFEIPAGKGYSKTIVTRVDSLQIEEYVKYTEISTDSGVFKRETKIIDTFYIKWKNNFFYTLKMKSPQTELDLSLIHI